MCTNVIDLCTKYIVCAGKSVIVNVNSAPLFSVQRQVTKCVETQVTEYVQRFS